LRSNLGPFLCDDSLDLANAKIRDSAINVKPIQEFTKQKQLQLAIATMRGKIK